MKQFAGHEIVLYSLRSHAYGVKRNSVFRQRNKARTTLGAILELFLQNCPPLFVSQLNQILLFSFLFHMQRRFFPR
jgi:hypothetical protein